MKFLSLVGFLGCTVAANAQCTFDGTILTSCSDAACPQGEYVVPPGTTSIGDGAFSECASLTSVTFPNSLESIGRNAFDDTGLTSVDLSHTQLNSIGRSAFSYTTLTEVTFPPSLTSIDNNAFGLAFIYSVVYLGNKPANAPTCVDPCEEVVCATYAEGNAPDVCSSENTADPDADENAADPNCSTDDPATFINNQCCKCN